MVQGLVGQAIQVQQQGAGFHHRQGVGDDQRVVLMDEQRLKGRHGRHRGSGDIHAGHCCDEC